MMLIIIIINHKRKKITQNSLNHQWINKWLQQHFFLVSKDNHMWMVIINQSIRQWWWWSWSRSRDRQRKSFSHRYHLVAVFCCCCCYTFGVVCHIGSNQREKNRIKKMEPENFFFLLFASEIDWFHFFFSLSIDLCIPLFLLFILHQWFPLL